MNRRLLGGAFVTACSLVALLGYVDRASGDLSSLTEGERAFLSRIASAIKGDDFILEMQQPDDLSMFAEADGSRLAPLEDADATAANDREVATLGNGSETPHGDTAVTATEVSPSPADAIAAQTVDPYYADNLAEEEEYINVTDVLVAMSKMTDEERSAFLERGRLPTSPLAALGESDAADDVRSELPASMHEVEILDEEDITPLDPETVDFADADSELDPVEMAEAVAAEATPAALPSEEVDSETVNEVTLSEEDIEWARLHNRDLVTLFDHITGYPLYAIEGEVETVPFTLPMPVDPPGAVLIRSYVGQEHLPQRYPGWCLTMVSFMDTEWNKYHWIHEGEKPKAEGRVAEVLEQIHGERIIPKVVENEILHKGEVMALSSICLDGVWDGLSPLEHSSLYRVLSGKDFGDSTMIRKYDIR